MTNLRKLGGAVFLTCAFALSALAECASPVPGQTEGPPCASGQVTLDDSVVPGDTISPPALRSETEYSIAEATVGLVMNVLFLF